MQLSTAGGLLRLRPTYKTALQKEEYKMKKRLLGLGLALVLLLSLFPTAAFADTTAAWVFDRENETLTSADGAVSLFAYEKDLGSGQLLVNLDTLPSGVESLDLGGAVEDTQGDPCSIVEIYAFDRTFSVSSLVLPGTIETIPKTLFSGCDFLTSVTLSEGTKRIETEAFAGCQNLTSLVLPDGLTEIGAAAFAGCSSLTSLVLPDGLQAIGENAFTGCSSLSQITFPQNGSLKTIGAEAFYDCTALTSLLLPEGLETVGEKAFASTRLRHILLPSTLKTLGSEAFYYLGVGWTESVLVASRAVQPPVMSGEAIDSGLAEAGLLQLYVPAAGLTAYQQAEGWKDLRPQSSNVWIGSDGIFLEAEEGYDQPLTQSVTLYNLTDAPLSIQLAPDTGSDVSYSDFTVSPQEAVLEPYGTLTATVTVPTGLVWDYLPYFGILLVTAGEQQQSIYVEISIRESGRSGFDVSFKPDAIIDDGYMETEYNAYTNYTLPECGYIRDGYKFAAWAENGPDGRRYQPGDAYTVTADVTFYAVWEVRTTSEAIPSSAVYDRNGNDGFSFTLLLPDGVSLRFVRSGTEILTEGTDYTVDGRDVCIAQAYLLTRQGEDVPFTFVREREEVIASVTVPETWEIRLVSDPAKEVGCWVDTYGSYFDVYYVPKGESVTLEAVPWGAVLFDGWLLDGELLETDPILKDFCPQGDVTLTMSATPFDALPDLYFRPDSVDFGTAAPGYTTPAAQTVIVSNTTDGVLNIQQPTSEAFTIEIDYPELYPGESATITIQPKAGLPVGDYSGAITFTAEKTPYDIEPRSLRTAPTEDNDTPEYVTGTLYVSFAVKAESPDTGDATLLLPLTIALWGSGAGLTVLLRRKRRFHR